MNGIAGRWREVPDWELELWISSLEFLRRCTAGIGAIETRCCQPLG
jgi:hypothetical protein